MGNSAVQGLSHSSPGSAESLCNACCPVGLGRPEVSADPACWFNVSAPLQEMAPQRKQTRWEQPLVSPHIRRAVGAHACWGRLWLSPVVVGTRMEGVAPAWPGKPTSSSHVGGGGQAALPPTQQDSVNPGGFRTDLFSLCAARRIQAVISNGVELTQGRQEQCCTQLLKKKLLPV